MGNSSVKHTRALEELQNRFHSQDAKLLDLATSNQNQKKEINELKREIIELKKKNDSFQALIDSPEREEELKLLREKATAERQIRSLEDLSELKSIVADTMNRLKVSPELVEVDTKRELDLIRNELETRKDMIDIKNSSLEVFEPIHMKALIFYDVFSMIYNN